MYNQFFNRVSDISSANQQRLTDSLRPIVFWMQILGNDFSISQQCWTLKRYCGIVYGIAVLAIMEVSAYVITISYSNISQTDTTSMTNWLRLIVAFQWKFWDFVFPLTMFYATSFNWKRLWNQARKMAKYFNYPVDFYEQLRKVITTSILSIIVLVNTFFFITKLQFSSEKLTAIYAGHHRRIHGQSFFENIEILESGALVKVVIFNWVVHYQPIRMLFSGSFPIDDLVGIDEPSSHHGGGKKFLSAKWGLRPASTAEMEAELPFDIQLHQRNRSILCYLSARLRRQGISVLLHRLLRIDRFYEQLRFG